MVFISLNMTLENFLKRNRNTRMDGIEWMLFDDHIKGRSLKDKSDFFGGGNHGNLGCYMNRTFYYPFYYKEPLHMYFMKEKTFRGIEFFPDTEEYKHISSVWNMKRVKEPWEEEKYPRILDKEMIWGNGTYEEHQKILRDAFEKLVNSKDEIAHVCIGE